MKRWEKRGIQDIGAFASRMLHFCTLPTCDLPIQTMSRRPAKSTMITEEVGKAAAWDTTFFALKSQRAEIRSKGRSSMNVRGMDDIRAIDHIMPNFEKHTNFICLSNTIPLRGIYWRVLNLCL